MAKKQEEKLTLAPGEEEAFLLFYNARSFHVAATKLEDLPQIDFFLWPTIMCEAFALELHLKCFLTLRNKPFGRIHECEDLFNLLDSDDKDLVRLRLEERILIDPLLRDARAEDGLRLDLESVLKRANRMFVRARYWHEGFTKQSIENDEMCTAGICALTDAITQIILDVRPDWTNEKMKSLSILRKSYRQPST